MFKDKTILVIGGTGTIGSELVKQLLGYEVHSIRIYARNEHKMWEIKQVYGENHPQIRYILGDIRNKSNLDLAMNGVDYCINAAALKHVSFCNQNPIEAVLTNVIGVQNAVECAVKNNINVFIQISTDKVCRPTNTYGHTKALAEDITLNAMRWRGYNRTKFAVIRLGNIIGSSGSVLEVWETQKKQGKKLTVTDLYDERYMGYVDDVVKTIIGIIQNVDNGLYILNMNKYTVEELLKSYYPDCEYELIGLQEGEKMHEMLYDEGEKFTLIDVEG